MHFLGTDMLVASTATEIERYSFPYEYSTLYMHPLSIHQGAIKRAIREWRSGDLSQQ
jgi:hypothetical protein